MRYELDPDTTRTTAWIWVVGVLLAAAIVVAVMVGGRAF